MKKLYHGLIACLLLTVCLFLSGCSFNSSVDELFVLPQVPMEFSDITTELDQLISSGYSYITPTGGTNIQSVQLHDFDYDGENEIFALLCKSEDPQPLKIAIFKQQNGAYVRFTTIESSGTGIDSIYYEDVNDDNRSELIVGWKISDSIHSVVVYSINRDAVQLMNTTYSQYRIVQLEENGIPNILVIKNDIYGNPIAEFYSWQKDLLAETYHCKLSSTTVEIDNGSIVVGKLPSGRNGFFITGVTAENMSQTDVLSYIDEVGVYNITLNAETQKTNAIYPYRQLSPQDLDGDGIVEIPCPYQVYDANGAEMASVDTIVSWYQYDVVEAGISSGLSKVSETYHCQSTGWYFTMPTAWWNRVTVNVIESGTNETEVMLTVDAQQILALYTITGENRENRGLLGNRFIVKRQTNTVIAAEIFNQSQYGDMTEDLLRKNFHLVVSSWSATA